MTDVCIRDDFAGPGGWEEALRRLGRTDVVGYEFDAAACATARAAGHIREQIDLRLARRIRAYRGGLEGYIASPPCQTFSAAGKGAGREALAALLMALDLVSEGVLPEDAVHAVLNDQLDERSVLVLEPLHVIRKHRPQWVALEQVPQVLPVWRAYAEVLEGWGYNVAVGYVFSEQYGVPQARKRAVLVAHQDRAVSLPTPTHSKYHARTPERLDEGVLPWLSLVDGLGYEPEQAVPGDSSWVHRRPSPTIVGSFAADVIAAPGYRKKGDPPRQKTPGSVRVTVEEAGVLQSFRPDYPWQGSKSKQFEQVGNAIPPLMAAAVLAPLIGEESLCPAA